MTLSANDSGGSGAGTIYYTVDAGVTQTYSGGAFIVSGSGQHCASSTGRPTPWAT